MFVIICFSLFQPKPSSSDHLLEAFKEELSCAICTQELQDPKDLDCCHTFCSECLQKWLDSQCRKTSIPCPVCLKDTDLKDSGIDGLKTSHVMKNLVDQVRSAMVGSTLNSPCKIHGIEGITVTVNCKTCEQFVCEKCVDVCKRLDHVVEDQPGRFPGGPPGHMLHPLSKQKQTCLKHLQANEKRQTSWGTQVDQIRRMVRTYADKLREKIQQDLEIKMDEIDKVEREGEEVFMAYASKMKEMLQQVDEVIDKQVELKAAAEAAVKEASTNQGHHLGPSQPQHKLRPSQPQHQLGPGQSQYQLRPGQPQHQLGPGQPQHQLGPSQPQHQLGPGQPQHHLGPSQPQHHLGPGQPQYQLGPGQPQYQLGPGQPPNMLGQQTLPPPWQPPPLGHPMPIPVGPPQGWPGFYGNSNQGFPASWQTWNPFLPPPSAMQQPTRNNPISAGNSKRHTVASGSTSTRISKRQNLNVARQQNEEVSKEQREADEESDKVLRMQISNLPPHRMLTFVASGHHLQDCPVGQVVCQWW